LQVKHVLLDSSGGSDIDNVSGNVNGIDGHNMCGAKWPNEKS
jgi:hypothetical protein